jgi:Mg2+-importing ATPase
MDAAACGRRAPRGLRSACAARRLASCGPNAPSELSGARKLLRTVLPIVRNPLVGLLLCLGALALAGGDVETAEVIWAMMALAVGLQVAQEARGERAASKLREHLEARCRVRRGADGLELVLVPARELVPGDLVELAAGDVIPADGVVVRSALLQVNQARLTGESAPALKRAATAAEAAAVRWRVRGRRRGQRGGTGGVDRSAFGIVSKRNASSGGSASDEEWSENAYSSDGDGDGDGDGNSDGDGDGDCDSEEDDHADEDDRASFLSSSSASSSSVSSTSSSPSPSPSPSPSSFPSSAVPMPSRSRQRSSAPRSSELSAASPYAVLSGSVVVGGTGAFRVRRTGDHSEIGRIVGLLREARPASRFDRDMLSFSWMMIRFIAVLAPLVLLVQIARQGWTLDALLYATSVSVGLAPEMLPMIVAACLVHGAARLARDQSCIVKRVAAVQSLGTMDVLCTDKTGTLTVDCLAVHRALDARGSDAAAGARLALLLAKLNAHFQDAGSNNLEKAVQASALAGFSACLEHVEALERAPFDYEARVASVTVRVRASSCSAGAPGPGTGAGAASALAGELVRGAAEAGVSLAPGGPGLELVKGAVEEVLSQCAAFLDGGRARPMRELDVDAALSVARATGERILAVALRAAGAAPAAAAAVAAAPASAPAAASAAIAASSLTLVGFVTFTDPPKASAAAAVASVHALGVAVKMLTGDAASVASHVANAVGIQSPDYVLEGAQVEALPSRYAQRRAVEACNVFARLTPAHKQMIVALLKSEGPVAEGDAEEAGDRDRDREELEANARWGLDAEGLRQRKSVGDEAGSAAGFEAGSAAGFEAGTEAGFGAGFGARFSFAPGRQRKALHPHSVGFLGDGVNDVAALQSADVGISVESACDAARSAADIVLISKDLTVFEPLLLSGRSVFANIVKYLKMVTSSNFGNMFSVVGASVLIPFIPMLPLQVVTQNLLYDLAQLGVPSDRVEREQLARPLHLNIARLQRFVVTVGAISSVFDYLTWAVLWFALGADQQPMLFRTGWFVEGLLSQTLVVFVLRTERPLEWLAQWLRPRARRFRAAAASVDDLEAAPIPAESDSSAPSPLLVALSLAVCGTGIALTALPAARQVLQFAPLPAAYWCYLALVLASYLSIAHALVKRCENRLTSRAPSAARFRARSRKSSDSDRTVFRV